MNLNPTGAGRASVGPTLSQNRAGPSRCPARVAAKWGGHASRGREDGADQP